MSSQMTTKKIKLADILIGDFCGVFTINLIGNSSKYYKLINRELYLIDFSILRKPGNYTVTISLEDPANRFSPVQKNYTLSVFPCGGEPVTTSPPGETTTTVDPSAFPPPFSFALSSETGEFGNPMDLCNTEEQYFSIVPHPSYYSYPYSLYVILYEVQVSFGPNYDTWASPLTEVTLSRLTNPVAKTFFSFPRSLYGGLNTTVRFRLRASLYHTYFLTELISSYIYDPNTYILCDN
jgi:hypothetical protein